MNAIVLIGGMCAAALPADSPPPSRMAPKDPLLNAFSRVLTGMPERDALALIRRPVESGGTEQSAPNWTPHRFAEWWGDGYKIRVLSQNGYVIDKQFQDLRERRPKAKPGTPPG